MASLGGGRFCWALYSPPPLSPTSDPLLGGGHFLTPASLVSLCQNYEHLFKVNDKAVGGSFYLQSKVSGRRWGRFLILRAGSQPPLGALCWAMSTRRLWGGGEALHSPPELTLRDWLMLPPAGYPFCNTSFCARPFFASCTPESALCPVGGESQGAAGRRIADPVRAPARAGSTAQAGHVAPPPAPPSQPPFKL